MFGENKVIPSKMKKKETVLVDGRANRYSVTITSEEFDRETSVLIWKQIEQFKSEIKQIYKQFGKTEAKKLIATLKYRDKISALRGYLLHFKLKFNVKRKNLEVSKHYNVDIFNWKNDYDYKRTYNVTLFMMKSQICQQISSQRHDFRTVRYLDKNAIRNFFGEGKDLRTRRVGLVRLEPGQILKAYDTKQLSEFFEDKTPKENKNYIGVELEFCAEYDNITLGKLLKEKGLDKYCKWSDDRSLRPKEKEQRHELAILIKESQINTILKQICNVVSKSGAQVEDRRCGLHVHLDARNRDREIVYNNLVACQDLFMEMSPPSRRDSEFCRRVDSKRFPKEFTGDRIERYKTINAAAFYRHKTIEVRTHEGTVNPQDVVNWVKLLVKIANYNKKIVKSVQTVKKLVDTFKIHANIERYVLDKINYWRINNEEQRPSIGIDQLLTLDGPTQLQNRDTVALRLGLEEILTRPDGTTNRRQPDLSALRLELDLRPRFEEEQSNDELVNE
jgi:hypothetical protein